jgi:hypothetical protein
MDALALDPKLLRLAENLITHGQRSGYQDRLIGVTHYVLGPYELHWSLAEPTVREDC